MLNPSEKAYCQALQALKGKQYGQALVQFEKASPMFAQDQEFGLLRETTRLLVEVQKEIAAADDNDENKLIIKESFTNGQETELS